MTRPRCRCALTVASPRAPRVRHFSFAAWGVAGKHDLGVLKPSLLDQRVERCGVLRRDSHAAMRDGFAEMPHLIAAVDGMTVFHEEDCMRHGSVVPFLAVPDLVHGKGCEASRCVEYPALPVDTGQSYRWTPSNKTVILCVDLSMLMTMVGAAGIALGAS